MLREYVDVIGVVLPELLPMVGFMQNNPHHRKDVWEHTLTVLENIPAEPALRWAALLHDAEKPACCTVDAEGIRHFHGHQQKSAETAEAILRRLHCETRLIADVTELIKIHDIRFPAKVETATRWAGRWGEKRFLRFAALRWADTLGQAHPEEAEPYYRALLAAFREAKEQDACFTVRQLAVSGDDLTGLGLSGPAVGETLRRLLRLVQGFIIGAGGILPGISGGVLSVIFGIYRPVMEVLAHPLNGLRRHLSLLLPVGAGAILGFLCGGGLILVLFDRSEKLATCLFIGLILGTLPSLWAEAGAQGRGRGAYLSCAASFLALSAVLLYAQYGAFYTMRPGFLGFLFCGLLWGLSLIVPGMTSSSILMAVGLFTPMAEGFARLDMAVILPWLLGMALIVLTLARVVNWCFQTHYPLFYHAVFGIVLASTVVIIPLHYDGVRDALLCLLAAALGALAAYLSAKLQPKEDA